MPILVTLSGIIIEVNWFFLKAKLSILVTVSGIINEFNFHSLKDCSPITVVHFKSASVNFFLLYQMFPFFIYSLTRFSVITHEDSDDGFEVIDDSPTINVIVIFIWFTSIESKANFLTPSNALDNNLISLCPLAIAFISQMVRSLLALAVITPLPDSVGVFPPQLTNIGATKDVAPITPNNPNANLILFSLIFFIFFSLENVSTFIAAL